MTRFLAARFACAVSVDQHRLGDLLANGLHRVEGMQRTLKDDRSRGPTRRPEAARR